LPRASKYIAAAASTLAPSPRNLFTGTSGWAYGTWKPGFYTADIPPRAFLHVYASRLNSVEVNYTFRTLPTAAQLQGWLDATPPGFQFSFKAPQRITHFQRLLNSHETVAELIAVLEPVRIAGKLGPILFQLPPNFTADPVRLADLLAAPALHPHSTKVSFEFRHESWFTENTYAMLRRHNAGLCIAESDDLVTPEVHTANFFCYRLRRSGGYKPAKLKTFASRFTALAQRGETFVYFKHEDQPTGALNAESMLRTAAKLAASNTKARQR
jgi:uncharacterized protein YecE (DUF72 family)